MTEDFTRLPGDASADQAALQKLHSLNTVGTISYILHLIVAVGALIPGGQFGPVLLIVALVIDLVKRAEAVGTRRIFAGAFVPSSLPRCCTRSLRPCGFSFLFQGGSRGASSPSGFSTAS